MTEKWIDVSAHNGIIDWPKVAAAGIKGVVIRAGYGNSITQQDKQFTANIKGAIAAGLKVTVYWFSYSDSVTDSVREWAVCKQIIEPYRKNILFVSSDYEYDSYNYYKRVHGAAPSTVLINQMVNAFLGAVKADGYGTMLYTNNDYRKNIFTPETLSVWDIWLADYTGGPDISCAMQQTGSNGQIPGVAGRVDTNDCFKDFAAAAASAITGLTLDGYSVDLASGKLYQVLAKCSSEPVVSDVVGLDVIKVGKPYRDPKGRGWLIDVQGLPPEPVARHGHITVTADGVTQQCNFNVK